MKSPNSLNAFEKVGYWMSIGFGLGLIPVAPGTFGSLLGPPLVWIVQTRIPGYGIQAMIGVVLFFLGVRVCDVGARVLGRKDPGAVVFDEIVAFFVVFAMIPVTWRSAILGFLLFRLFDISKPWPVKRLEKLPGGWGVMVDDLMAGLYAGLCLVVILNWVIPFFFPDASFFTVH